MNTCLSDIYNQKKAKNTHMNTVHQVIAQLKKESIQ